MLIHKLLVAFTILAVSNLIVVVYLLMVIFGRKYQ
jgi:hypothetical protein